MRVSASLLFLSLVLFSCSRATVDRTQWQKMPAAEKTLWVRQMIGAEKAKEAKGGNDRAWSQPPEAYVVRIDEAYSQGERRDVRTLFESMSDSR